MLRKRDCKLHDPTTPRGKLGRAHRGGGRGGAAHARRCIIADVYRFPFAATLLFSPVRWPTGARRWGWMKVLCAGWNSLLRFPLPSVRAVPLCGVLIQPPSHRWPDWSRRLGFCCPGRLRAQPGLGNPYYRLGPTSDRALDFYRVPPLVPPLGRRIPVGSREVGG